MSAREFLILTDPKILLSTVDSSLNGRELQPDPPEGVSSGNGEWRRRIMCWRWRLWVIRAEGFERLCDAIEEIDRRESLKYREEAVEKEPLKNGK